VHPINPLFAKHIYLFIYNFRGSMQINRKKIINTAYQVLLIGKNENYTMPHKRVFDNLLHGTLAY